MIPALLIMVLKSYLAALEKTQVVLWVTLAAVVVNLAVAWALIFGHWGAPELGVRGAAIASLSTQTLTAVLLSLYAALSEGAAGSVCSSASGGRIGPPSGRC
jgi:MATE family multidrug resistance protein